jgi:hypothetical protein
MVADEEIRAMSLLAQRGNHIREISGHSGPHNGVSKSSVLMENRGLAIFIEIFLTS